MYNLCYGFEVMTSSKNPIYYEDAAKAWVVDGVPVSDELKQFVVKHDPLGLLGGHVLEEVKLVEHVLAEAIEHEKASEISNVPTQVQVPAAPTKEQHNASILRQLEEIDLRSIRALRTSDVPRMLDYETQAILLRQKLLK